MEDKQIYMGIENEFTSFVQGIRTTFSPGYIFLESKVGKKHDIFEKTPSSMRTSQGLAFYVDQKEIEICTPPIHINKGFATRLTDILEVGRNEIANSWRGYKHTGFSMHWNLSDNTRYTENKSNKYIDEFHYERSFEEIGPAAILFGNTPLSVGARMRKKPRRLELLADHIDNIEQVNAFALLYGAYAIAKHTAREDNSEREYQLPITTSRLSIRGPVVKGRDARIPFFFNTNYVGHHRIQDYVETLYSYLMPIIKELGTDEEIQNLEDFITGKKQLEFDKYKYYGTLKNFGLKSKKTYRAIADGTLLGYTDKLYGQTIQPNSETKELPVEAQLLGYYPKLIQKSQKKHKASSMDWSLIWYLENDDIESIVDLYNIHDIYQHAAEKLNLEYEKTAQLQHIRLEEPTNIIISDVKYDPEQDTSAHPFSWKLYKEQLPKHLSSIYNFTKARKVFRRFVLSAIIGGTIGLIGRQCSSSPDTIDIIIKKYEKNIENSAPESTGVTGGVLYE